MGSETLPEDMIFEILSRSSLQTLDRCKSVSKEWKKMTYEASFQPLHSRRSRCIFGYFFQNMRRGRYSSALVTACGGGDAVNWSSCDGINIVASCNQGILCCEKKINHQNYRYYVCKPTTNQWQGLPNPKLRYKTDAVAIVVGKSQPLHFTIVRLSWQMHQAKYNCEVFDSKAWAWEKIEDPILSENYLIISSKTGVSIGESIYWFTHDHNVLAFDLNKKRFRCFSLPEEIRSDYNFKRIGEYEGGLALTYKDEERKKMELWVARGESWSRKMMVDIAVLEGIFPYFLPVEFCNSDVAFVRTISVDGAAMYNVKNGRFSRINVAFNVRGARDIFRFRSDFERVDLKPNVGRALRINRRLRRPQGVHYITLGLLFCIHLLVMVLAQRGMRMQT